MSPERIKISIGDTVAIKHRVKIVSYGDTTLVLHLLKGTTILTEIVVPRFISSLGQFLPGQNWHVPLGDYTLTENFLYTGKYIMDDELRQAEQYTQEALDGLIESYLGEIIDGAIFWGKVVYIYGKFTLKGELTDSDIEFYNNTKEAEADHYISDVLCVIQDQGSDIEYSIPSKHLTIL